MYRVSPIPEDFNPPPGSKLDRIYHKFCELTKPKKEELDYVCTEEELKLISQHYELKVDMTKFNVLDHFYKIFEKRGSIKNRSKASTLRQLMRAYNRYKNNTKHIYTEEEITEILREEWEERKAHTVRFLKRRSESSENKNPKKVVINNNSNDNNDDSNVSDESLMDSEETVIRSCPLDESERSESSENKNPKEVVNNNNSNDNNNDSNVSDESLMESEETVIRSCPIDEPEPIVISEAPAYAEMFFTALNFMRKNRNHVDSQCTEDDDGDDISEQNEPEVALEVEVRDNVESVNDDLGNLGMNPKHVDIQCTEDDDGDDITAQNAPENSLVALEMEVCDNIESEEVDDDLGNTDSIMKSVIQSQSTEGYNAFQHGASVSSTQGSQKP